MQVVAAISFLETNGPLWCTESISSLKSGGSGHLADLRVRLLHATVRKRILSLASADLTYFDKAAFGIPINDQDCIGTILAFSANLIWIAFPLQGIFLTQQETNDYSEHILLKHRGERKCGWKVSSMQRSNLARRVRCW
jgi:hypothetical protein